jgi:hypothetical protein
MKRIAKALASLALLLSLGVPAARADLYCPQPIVEVGTVRTGAVLTRQFVLHNRGASSVEITGMIPSCGCLAPQLDKRRLGPNEQVGVVLEVATLGLAEGPQSWRVRLCYRDEGAGGELSLALCGNVITEVQVQPAALVIHADTGVAHSVTLTDRRPQPLTITAVDTTTSGLRPRLGEVQRSPAGHWTQSVSLDVQPDCPEGRQDGLLHIRTSDPVYGDLRVPVTLIKRSRQHVSALPAEIKVAGTYAEPLPSQRVLLSAAEDQEVVVERIDTNHPALKCQWARGPGPMTTVKIQFDHVPLTAGLHQAAIQVHLLKPRAETLTIPVSWDLK